MYLLTTFLV